jgi:hypothetical protein
MATLNLVVVLNLVAVPVARGPMDTAPPEAARANKSIGKDVV